MKKQNKILIILGIILLFLLSGYLNYYMYNNLKDQKQINNALQDSQHVTFNKLGQATTTIAVLQGSNKDLRQVKDSMYNRIKAIEKHYKRKLADASTFDLVTKDTSKGKTIVLKGDTLTLNNSTKIVYPVYTSDILNLIPGTKDTATFYKVTAKRDFIHIIAEIKNPVDVNQRWTREFNDSKLEKIFGKKNLVTDIKTYNHKTQTHDLKSFNVSQPRKYTGLKLGVTLLLGILLGTHLH